MDTKTSNKSPEPTPVSLSDLPLKPLVVAVIVGAAQLWR